MWLIFTGYLAAAFALQVPKGYNQENLILGLIYAWFTLYMIFNHLVPTTVVTKPLGWAYDTLTHPFMRFSRLVRSIIYTFFVFCVIVVTVFSLPEKEDSTRVQRLIALFGMVVFIALMTLFSKVRPGSDQETWQQQLPTCNQNSKTNTLTPLFPLCLSTCNV